MTSNLATLDFLERCNSAACAEEVKQMLFSQLGAFGFIYVACASHTHTLRAKRAAPQETHVASLWPTDATISGERTNEPAKSDMGGRQEFS